MCVGDSGTCIATAAAASLKPSREPPRRMSAAAATRGRSTPRAFRARGPLSLLAPLLLRDLFAHALFLRTQLGREFLAEVLRLIELPDLDLGLVTGEGVRRTLDPLDRLFLRFHLP